jgi:hypothetical protein
LLLRVRPTIFKSPFLATCEATPSLRYRSTSAIRSYTLRDCSDPSVDVGTPVSGCLPIAVVLCVSWARLRSARTRHLAIERHVDEWKTRLALQVRADKLSEQVTRGCATSALRPPATPSLARWNGGNVVELFTVRKCLFSWASRCPSPARFQRDFNLQGYIEDRLLRSDVVEMRPRWNRGR